MPGRAQPEPRFDRVIEIPDGDARHAAYSAINEINLSNDCSPVKDVVGDVQSARL